MLDTKGLEKLDFYRNKLQKQITSDFNYAV